MIGWEIDSCKGEELLRLVRALGRHRYVASRLHLVHAFAFAAAGDTPELAEARAWAARALEAGVIDLASRDERLYRRATDPELVAVLEAFWGPAPEAAKGRLRARLEAIEAPIDDDALPFDEAREDEMFPVLIDAGWELCPIALLDPERHRGAIEAIDDLEVARFEEENAIPKLVTLHELPVLGAVELLAPFDAEGRTRAPFVLWQEGRESYLDYVLRGVIRAAKLEREA